MNTFLTTLIVGISLSMDAFSLALVYGTQGLDKRSKIILSLIVGIYHFVMPLIGLLFGNMIFNYFIFDVNLIVGIIFSIIGLEMVISSKRDEEIKVFLSLGGFLLFGFSVSIDSLTTGIGLMAINNDYLEVAFIFMIVSGLFTYMGVRFGNKLSDRFGKYATIVGGGILVVLGLYYIFVVS